MGGQSLRSGDSDDWPTFELAYTFAPGTVDGDSRFEPDEVVFYDPAVETGDTGESGDVGRWLAAKPDAYLPIEELR